MTPTPKKIGERSDIPMMLFGKGSEKESAEAFWKRTEEKRGGPAGFKTVGTFLGRSGSKAARLPGLIYTVGEWVWFEDFENENWMSRVLRAGLRYEKTEFGFPFSDVRFTRVVSRGVAYRCVWGGIDPLRTRALSGFVKLFTTPTLQIGFLDGCSLFFEVLRLEEFLRFLEEPRDRKQTDGGK
jgi:hypothetical protein